MTPNDFFDLFGEPARRVCHEFGLSAAGCLSQMAQESGWAKKMPPGSNNPFGLKYREREGGDYVWHWTPEYYPELSYETDATDSLRPRPDLGDGWWGELCRFRAFASPEEAIRAYCERLTKSGYYDEAIALMPDIEACVRAICRIYATRPTYGDEVWNRILKYGLLRYDE